MAILPLPRLEIPRRVRALVRAREISIVILALVIGSIAGLVAAAMAGAVDVFHIVFFGLTPGERLSALSSIDPVRALAVPTFGGLALGFIGFYLRSRRPEREIDPIEANALHGGRMSLVGSLIVAGQTVWSSGVGASVGIEAGYTQLASGVASRAGQAFRLRRGDLRILVGCGAAGGIAAAFGAPLAGAFYAFELVIGGYSVVSLAPVAGASLLGLIVARALTPAPLGIFAGDAIAITSHDLALAAVLGLLSGFVGIGIMRAVAFCEALLGRAGIRPALRPALGGFVVGLCALASPQVMSSGHGALYLAGVLDRPIGAIAMVFLLKACASVVSLGSGFRGGLFFASLLLGALGGSLFAAALSMGAFGLAVDVRAYAVIGMGALSASVIGAPLTMTFIALETTGDLGLTSAVLVAVVVSALVTRDLFGYSFATWRFHLRGETIRGAADVGWIRDLTVERMMRHDVKTTPVESGVSAFRRAFPLGSGTRVAAVDGEGRYAGMILVSEAYAPELPDAAPLRQLLHHADDFLLPQMTVKTALEIFDRTEGEALAVVDSTQTRRVLGLLTEAHALRRYAEEFERRRREILGD